MMRRLRLSHTRMCSNQVLRRTNAKLMNFWRAILHRLIAKVSLPIV